MAKAKHPWFRSRPYRHFDDAIGLKVAEALASNPSRVSKHSFYPFISVVISEPRYKKALQKVEYKDRRIAYAAHRDAAIFAYYSYLLSPKYEQFLATNDLTENVIGYRSLGKSNIQFAQEIFELISLRRKPSLAIGLDIEGFFDNISHRVLKSNISDLLAQAIISPDHYQVFRAMTKWSYASKDAVCGALSIPRNSRGNARLCDAPNFRTRIRDNGLLTVNTNDFGIPQGSPLSALYSNIAMMRFDVAVKKFIQSIGGEYRRYSDDICVVVDVVDRARAIDFIKAQLAPINLQIKDAKTEVATFHYAGKLPKSDRPFQYLGFTYDGTKALIRSKSISRYWRKQIKAIKASKRSARLSARNGGPSQIFVRKLVRRFTHLGKQNFIKYAQRAAKVHNSSGIENQISRHWEKFMKDIS